jgi:hypothetical protein
MNVSTIDNAPVSDRKNDDDPEKAETLSSKFFIVSISRLTGKIQPIQEQRSLL